MAGKKLPRREVDEVLMEHSGMAQAVTFAMPHLRLGEDIAAAVVLRHNASVQREICASSPHAPSAFKVPRQVLMVEELPKRLYWQTPASWHGSIYRLTVSRSTWAGETLTVTGPHARRWKNYW